MNLYFSKTLFLSLLVFCCCSTTLTVPQVNGTAQEQPDCSKPPAVRQAHARSQQLAQLTVTEVNPIPATTGTIESLVAWHPERALVVVRRSKRQFSPSDMCAGILVSARIVITAAHCFYDSHGFYRRFPSMFGVTYRRQGGVYWDVTQASRRANLLVAHPNYKETDQLNDIGAMRLEKSVCEGCLISIGQSIPMALWRSDDLQLEMMMFSIENDQYSSIKMGRMPVRRTKKFTCENAYHRWGIHIGPKQICIESLDPEFYHRGESAILLLNDQPIGVLSFKLDVSSTANSLPYIYTDLTRYLDFIQKEIRNEAAQKLQPYRICSSIIYVVISLGIVR